MRAWACGEVGTDTLVTVPVDPYINIETGETVDTVDVWDWRRPEHDTTTAGVKFPIEGRNPTQPLWFVVDHTATVAPAGAFDLGDPSDPAWQSTALTNPEKNYLSRTFPDDADMAAAQTRGDVLLVFTPRFRATTGRDVLAEWGN